MRASIRLDLDHHAGEIDRRIFSGFLEHLGRAVYEGVYDPGNPLSDVDGIRRDVLQALKPMNMPLIRYPGGNFVSCYDWRDGIGPREKRPARPDFAWKSIEPNTFGVDEFMSFCDKLGTRPMMAVNLGTAGAAEAASLLEYCNLPTGTHWASQRVANGHTQPYGIKTWCLGNEMDGPWQAGHVPAEVYAQRADQAGKMMKGLDSTIELVVCGSSGRGMSTYMEWDRKVLEYCWDGVEYISAHRYSSNSRNDTAWYLGEGVEIDRIIDDYAALLGYVRAVKKSNRHVYLSFDEWNAWYREMNLDGGWKRAPHLLEEVYNLEDALVCAQYLNSFIRHANVLKMACLAQITNVIAPILTRKEGILLQSIYYPFVMYSQHAQGNALHAVIDGPSLKAGERGAIPAIDAAVCHNPASGTFSAFFVNRSLSDEIDVEMSVAGARISNVIGVEQIKGNNPKLCNTWENPRAIQPASGDAQAGGAGEMHVKLPRLGFVHVRGLIATQ